MIFKLRAELRQVLAELELVSQVPAVNLESSRDMGEDIGGKRPPGGEDHGGDREIGWPLKSVTYFRRRMAKAHTAGALEAILEDARTSLDAAKRQPAPEDKEHPMPGDYNWKRWVSESSLSDVEIARKCSVSRQYINRIRGQYREAQAA